MTDESLSLSFKVQTLKEMEKMYTKTITQAQAMLKKLRSEKHASADSKREVLQKVGETVVLNHIWSASEKPKQYVQGKLRELKAAKEFKRADREDKIAALLGLFNALELCEVGDRGAPEPSSSSSSAAAASSAETASSKSKRMLTVYPVLVISEGLHKLPGFVVAQRDGRLTVFFCNIIGGEHLHLLAAQADRDRVAYIWSRVFSRNSIQSRFQPQDSDGKWLPSFRLSFMDSMESDLQTVGVHHNELGLESGLPTVLWSIIRDYILGSNYQLDESSVSKLIAKAEADYKPVRLLNEKKEAAKQQKQEEKKKKKGAEELSSVQHDHEADEGDEKSLRSDVSDVSDVGGMDGDYDLNRDFESGLLGEEGEEHEEEHEQEGEGGEEEGGEEGECVFE
jgi:hypothetical protein